MNKHFKHRIARLNTSNLENKNAHNVKKCASILYSTMRLLNER